MRQVTCWLSGDGHLVTLLKSSWPLLHCGKSPSDTKMKSPGDSSDYHSALLLWNPYDHWFVISHEVTWLWHTWELIRKQRSWWFNCNVNMRFITKQRSQWLHSGVTKWVTWEFQCEEFDNRSNYDTCNHLWRHIDCVCYLCNTYLLHQSFTSLFVYSQLIFVYEN